MRDHIDMALRECEKRKDRVQEVDCQLPPLYGSQLQAVRQSTDAALQTALEQRMLIAEYRTRQKNAYQIVYNQEARKRKREKEEEEEMQHELQWVEQQMQQRFQQELVIQRQRLQQQQLALNLSAFPQAFIKQKLSAEAAGPAGSSNCPTLGDYEEVD